MAEQNFPEQQADAEIDVTAKTWIQQQVDKEVKRVRGVGSTVIPLKIINCGIVANFDVKRPRAINRVELDTQIDLSNVQQVMVSPEIEYPHKPDFCFVHLILLTEKPIPFLVPYLYQLDVKVTQPERQVKGETVPSKEIVLKNDLREFLFINKKGIRGRFTIHQYHSV